MRTVTKPARAGGHSTGLAAGAARGKPEEMT
jgi:hypothetical protein